MCDKAVLIFDMPRNCKYCMFRQGSEMGWYMCNLNKCEINLKETVKPKSCPLKPLPEFLSTEHVDYAHEASEINGWNKCLKIMLEDDLK